MCYCIPSLYTDSTISGNVGSSSKQKVGYIWITDNSKTKQKILGFEIVCILVIVNKYGT